MRLEPVYTIRFFILKIGASILWESEAQRRITSCSLRECVKAEFRESFGGLITHIGALTRHFW